MSTDIDQGGLQETREYITVTIGGQSFGVPIEDVHDVFPPQGMTSVALSRPEIAGVLNMRGRIVTAIDARRRLDLPQRPADGNCMAIGIEHGGESYGVLVDRVGEVLRLARSGLEPNPVNLDRRWAHVAAGVYRLDDTLLVILDVTRFLALHEENEAA